MRYEGELKNDKRHGQGILIAADGENYEGEFENDFAHGEGIFTWVDGVRSEGIFRDGGPWNVIGYDENNEICGAIVDGKLQEVYTSSPMCATQDEYQEQQSKILTQNRR